VTSLTPLDLPTVQTFNVSPFPIFGFYVSPGAYSLNFFFRINIPPRSTRFGNRISPPVASKLQSLIRLRLWIARILTEVLGWYGEPRPPCEVRGFLPSFPAFHFFLLFSSGLDLPISRKRGSPGLSFLIDFSPPHNFTSEHSPR